MAATLIFWRAIATLMKTGHIAQTKQRALNLNFIAQKLHGKQAACNALFVTKRSEAAFFSLKLHLTETSNRANGMLINSPLHHSSSNRESV